MKEKLEMNTDRVEFEEGLSYVDSLITKGNRELALHILNMERRTLENQLKEVMDKLETVMLRR